MPEHEQRDRDDQTNEPERRTWRRRLHSIAAWTCVAIRYSARLYAIARFLEFVDPPNNTQ